VKSPDLLRQRFRTAYGGEPLICRAPGRVNLIGEHTDYNDGFVMPVAIDMFTWAAVKPRQDTVLNVASLEMDKQVSTSLHSALQPRRDWSDYVIGVFAQLQNTGRDSNGADVLVHGEVPLGAGLSSSAALEASTGFAALRSNGVAVDRTQLALLCQRAENQFVGTKCGIMDQFISCHGQAGHALMLDCRSLEFSLLPIPADVRIVICNTMVKHELAGGEYNARRAECEAGVRLLVQWLPGIKALRDVSMSQYDQYSERLPEVVRRRCRHVVAEDERAQRAAEALRSGALDDFGRLMAESHRSLRDDYEVSCRELDVMVEIANKQPGVYGARMTGGGFGGCTVNLVEAAQTDNFVAKMQREYQAATGIRPQVYVCSAADGACELP
jgi:galactokinase